MSNGTLKLALSHGWKKVRNRNGMVAFRCDQGMILGSVQWYPSGAVNVITRGSSNLGMAKGLFCKAFNWLSDSELNRLCEGIFQESIRHHFIDTGKELPLGLNIDKFQKTHGLRFFTDNTRPGNTWIEAEETVPLYLQTMLATENKLAENIESHMKLITAWQEEAARRRQRAHRTRKPRKKSIRDRIHAWFK
jgi:hypothetical protein